MVRRDPNDVVRQRQSTIGMLGLGLALLAACDAFEEAGQTPGELDRVRFEYRQGCFFGCPLEQPLLAGTRQTIGVTGPGNGAGVEAISGDTDIARFAVERECHCVRDDRDLRIAIDVDASCSGMFTKDCRNKIRVETRSAGDVVLTLQGAGGAAIDRVTLRVREAASSRFFATLADRLGRSEQDSIRLGSGQWVELDLELYDDQGRKLLAPDGLRWQVDPPDVVELSAFLTGAGAEIETGLSARVEALEAGEVTLRVAAPGHAPELPIQVEAADAP